MTRRSSCPLIVALVLLAACGESRRPPGELVGVSPATFTSAYAGTLSVSGRGFAPSVRADFDQPLRSEASLAYRAWLSGAGGEHELGSVSVVNEEQIEARVERGTAPGTYALKLEDARGRTVTLADAVTVTPECATDAECTRPGVCQAAGHCVASVCEYEPVPVGAVCDDGDLCTTGDERCDGDGRCIAAAAVTCGPPPACHDGPGVCNPATGACGYLPSAAGTACDDGDACSVSDHCDGQGRCASEALACAPPAQCHDAGVCSSESGACSYAPLPEGTACDDGNLCTVGTDVCGGAGECTGTPLVCDAPNECQLPSGGACNPATGTCEYQPLVCNSPPNNKCFDPAGTCTVPGGCAYTVRVGIPCNDNNPCTGEDATEQATCTSAGACTGQWDSTLPGCANNLPPRACLTVRPRAVHVGEPVTIDARCSTDAEEPTAALKMRLDFDHDGTWDENVAFAAGQPQSWTRTFSQPGLYRVQVQVQDNGPPALEHWAETFVAVAPTPPSPAADLLFVVSTPDLDEDDTGDNSGSGTFDIRTNPKGKGRSLREVVRYLNSSGTTGAIVTFASDDLHLSGSPLPSLDAASAIFIGRGQTELDFLGRTSGATACVDANGVNMKWIGIDITGCGTIALQLKANGVHVAESRITPHSPSSTASVKAQSVLGAVFGPRNVVENWTSADAFEVKAPNVRIVRNVFRNNRRAISLNKVANTVVEGNVFVGHSSTVIQVPSGAPDMAIRFNTFVDSGATAISLQTSTNQTVQNNLFANTTGYAIAAPSASAVNAEPNGFFNSGNGHLSWGTPGANSPIGDPLFVDHASGDYRLRPSSAMVDRGAPLGVDVNGSKDGDFDPTAPDLGAHESPF